MRAFLVRTVLLVVCGIMWLVVLADEEPQAFVPTSDVTTGTLRVITKEEAKPLDFPLRQTDVKAQVSGFIARVEVTQAFHNPYKEKIEAVYIFPLPEGAAVDDMVMKVGERTIRGVIKKREEAREIYEAAKARGQLAGLLEQERPNIFTQSVANIMPGEEILITIRYVQVLTYDDGRYEFVFPMVVGPRYIPGRQLPSPPSGGGWSGDTDQVPDASRITPPVLKPGQRSGHDISLSLELNAGIPIQDLKSKSHQVEMKRQGRSRASVRIKEADAIPNKDFILEYYVAGKRPEVALLTHRSDAGGFFMLMLQPQAEFKAEEITPKEMVFVVDCSGSMSGEPIAKAKEAMRRLIRGMNPGDSFQIIRFSVSASQFSPLPIPNTPENVRRGLSYINGMRGQGGTEMIEGIKAALDFPPDPQRLRIVFFMTDGYIGNEAHILSAIEDKLGDARLFSFGVGSSVNRYLLDRMAEVGRGTVQYVRPDEDTEKAVNKFYERISTPYLTDIEVDWKGLEVADLYPGRIPDLFSAQPVIILGRYSEPGRDTIELKGKVAGKSSVTRIKAALPQQEEENAVLGTLWARARIRDLMSQMYHGEKPELVEKVTDLALEFRLMSRYTSFVAVEEKIVREGEGPPRKVMVPVEMPEGVSYEGVFGPAGEFEEYDKAGVGYRFRVTGGGGLSPLSRPRESARRAVCKSNLKQIGLAILIYVNDHNVFPSTFEALIPDYISVPSLQVQERTPFQCPAEANPATTVDYELVALGNPKDIAHPEKAVLAYDKKGNHPGGRNVVFADAHVEWMSETDFQTALKETLEVLKKRTSP